MILPLSRNLLPRTALSSRCKKMKKLKMSKEQRAKSKEQEKNTRTGPLVGTLDPGHIHMTHCFFLVQRTGLISIVCFFFLLAIIPIPLCTPFVLPLSSPSLTHSPSFFTSIPLVCPAKQPFRRKISGYLANINISPSVHHYPPL